jgi:hypothetical protein
LAGFKSGEKMDSDKRLTVLLEPVSCNQGINTAAEGNGGQGHYLKKDLLEGRTDMARVGHAGTQSSQILHFPWSNSTRISGRQTLRAPVGQTAVHAPQWVHPSSSRFTSWDAFWTLIPLDFRYLTPSLKSFLLPDSSKTINPSLRGNILAWRILKVRS